MSHHPGRRPPSPQPAPQPGPSALQLLGRSVPNPIAYEPFGPRAPAPVTGVRTAGSRAAGVLTG